MTSPPFVPPSVDPALTSQMEEKNWIPACAEMSGVWGAVGAQQYRN
jgi:hypothetical protein